MHTHTHTQTICACSLRLTLTHLYPAPAPALPSTSKETIELRFHILFPSVLHVRLSTVSVRARFPPDPQQKKNHYTHNEQRAASSPKGGTGKVAAPVDLPYSASGLLLLLRAAPWVFLRGLTCGSCWLVHGRCLLLASHRSGKNISLAP